MTHLYSLCGRRLRSDLPLTWLRPLEGAGKPELFLEAAGFPDPEDAPRASTLMVSAHAACDVVRVPGLLRLRVEKDRFTLDLSAGVDPAEAQPFLFGVGLALWAHRNGLATFQGAAVADASGTLLVLGTTGAGKSSLAAALCRRGLAPVADGVVVVDSDSGAVLPVTSVIPLWADAAKRLGIETEGLAPVRAGLRKYAWPAAPSPVTAPPPVAGVVLLTEKKFIPEPVLGPRRPAAGALARLMTLRHSAVFDARPPGDRGMFRALSRLAGAGAHELERPADLASPDALADAALRLLQKPKAS